MYIINNINNIIYSKFKQKMKTYITGYFYKKLDKFILNVKFKIPNNGITFIMGHSGSGKSTLLKCISGITKPNIGFLNINKNCLQNSKKNIFIKPEKRNISLIFQSPYLFPHMSIIENLKFGFNRTKETEKKINIEEVINKLKLNKLIKKKTYNLSGGETQRITIGQSLLSSPTLLLMDEPLSAQDTYMKKTIKNYLKYINKKHNIPIIYISHSINEIKNFGDYLIFMKNGKINNTKLNIIN